MMWPLLGIGVVVIGFALRFNPLLVVAMAAIVTGLLGGLDLGHVVAAYGKAFNDNRYVSIPWVLLPAIGALERAGLQERARDLVAGLKGMTVFRLLCLYLLIRQVTAALGLTALGGHPQMVRPLIAPMAEAAAEARLGRLPEEISDQVRAQAAATDNIALFFGEDIFVAIGSILLMQAFLAENGIVVEPLQLSLWAMPTALAAFLTQGIRLFAFERALRRLAAMTVRTR